MQRHVFEGELAGYEIMKLVPQDERILVARFNRRYTIITTVRKA